MTAALIAVLAITLGVGGWLITRPAPRPADWRRDEWWLR